MDKRHDIARDLARRYGTLTKEQIEQLGSLLVPMRVGRNKLILDAGSVCRHFYYVERGTVRLFYNKNGKELTEHIGCDGSVVTCIESLFKERPSYLTIEAIEPTRLYALPLAEFRQLCESSYAFCRLYMSILEESLIISQQKADTLHNEIAKERYLRTLRDNPDIVRRAPLRIVASYLQMTPETLSRVRAQMNAEYDCRSTEP